MNESHGYDYDLDGDGAWETVSKNKKPKDKMKMDQKAAAPVKKPGAKGVKPASGAAGKRRQSKQGNGNMAGKKPAPLTNWREAAKRKAETTEKQKRALLKNVQIGRSAKNPPEPVNRKPMKSSAKNVGKGENINPKGKEAEKKKFDSFQKYNESFPDLPKSESTEEEVGTAIPSHPVQDYSNLPPFYDLNGCDISADIVRVLNAAFMSGPGNPPLHDQSALHGLTQFIQPLQKYQIEDGLIDSSGYMRDVSYGGCVGENGTFNLHPSEVNAGGELHDITREELFNIPVDKAQPSIVESQDTGDIHQEFKVNNLLQDVNLHTRSDYQEKAIAEKNVFDEKQEYTPVKGVRDLVPDTGNGNVSLTKIPMKRKKRVKVQNKDKGGGSMPQNVERQGNTDIHAQEDSKEKINGSNQEAIAGKNQTDSIRGDLKEKLPTRVNKSTNLIYDIASQVTTGMNDSEENENKDMRRLESASMDSLTSAVANLNISKTDSSTAFKCDNQNNNCQEAGNDDDESCLELTGLELKCNPDCFDTMSYVTSQTHQETARKTDATGQAEDIVILQGCGEEARPGETPSLQETTENEEIAETKEVQAEFENDTADSEYKSMTVIESTEADLGGQQKRENDSGDNEDDAQDDALRMCQPCNNTSQNTCPGERQERGNENQKNPQEPVVERKVTYGDVIEYVMEQLKELYSGADVDGFNPVIKIEHEPLPDELTRHLTLLRQLSYNYTPSLHPYDRDRGRFSESSDSDWSDSLGDSDDDIERNDERSGPVNKDGGQMPLKRFHEKLQMFAQLNHLHQIVSNPRLTAFLEDWKLQGSTEQFTYDGLDLFPDLIKSSKPILVDDSVLGNSAYGVTEMVSPCDVISPIENGEKKNAQILSFDYGKITETVENLMSSHELERSGIGPTEKEQTFQTSGAKESAPSHSARLIQEEGVQESPRNSEVRSGAEDSWRSLISSPHRASVKGLQFFQHSFLSSPENMSDGCANDSRQDNSQRVTEHSEQSSHLANISHFLWSKLTDVRASLDREIMGLTSQKEHKERTWQGGDMMETRRREYREATGVTTDQNNDVTNNVIDVKDDIGDDDLLDKGWMDRSLVDNLINPKDEEPIEKRNRREYRSKKFGILPFWWMS